MFQHTAARRQLDTIIKLTAFSHRFNTQPPEGGWEAAAGHGHNVDVSTHSRPKAAVKFNYNSLILKSFNTQPPEGGWPSTQHAARSLRFQHTAARRRLLTPEKFYQAQHSFNTQPPEGGWQCDDSNVRHIAGFNTQPPEGGCSLAYAGRKDFTSFQHTAARRRLADNQSNAAPNHGFNTQPPEGGWPKPVSNL